MKYETIVEKYGASSVTNGHGMDIDRIGTYVEGHASLQAEGYRLIVVSSGAVAVGESLWRELNGAKKLPTKRLLAMLGSAGVVEAWRDEYKKHGILAGQLLTTHNEMDDPGEGGNLKRALRDSLREGVVPVGNENDAVSSRELARLFYGGENDGLATHIAILMGASKIIYNTGLGGLFDGSTEISRVEATRSDRARARQIARANNSQKGQGRGGIKRKIEAALKAAWNGIDAYVVEAGTDFEAIVTEERGTHFVARPKRT